MACGCSIDSAGELFGSGGSTVDAATEAPESGGSAGVGGNVMVCAPGQQIACACGGSVDGAQACNVSGTGYGACQCPDAPDAASTGGVGGVADAGSDVASAGSSGAGGATSTGGSGGQVPDAAPVDAGPACGTSARFEKCSKAYPAAAAKVTNCTCGCGYAGCPTCSQLGNCGSSFCDKPTTGSMSCTICLDWFFTNYANKCEPCGDGSCDEFLSCLAC